MSEQLGIAVEIDRTFDEAIDVVTAALKEQGFGVLTRIDVDKTLKEKIGVDFRPYAILGACNPVLAHKALSTLPEVGLFLPCNVTVETTPEGKTLVRIIDAMQMMGVGAMGDDPAMCEIATEASTKLNAVADRLRAS